MKINDVTSIAILVGAVVVALFVADYVREKMKEATA